MLLRLFGDYFLPRPPTEQKLEPGKPQALLLAVVCILVAEGQNNRRPNRRQNRRPNQRQQNRNRGVFGRNGVTRNGARDARGTEVYPGCSGKVCLPEAQLCAERKQKVKLHLTVGN